MPAPPLPFLAEEHHGKLAVFAMLTSAGVTEAGERAVAPFRSLAKPWADMVRPMRYPEMYQRDDPDYHPMAVVRMSFVDDVDRTAFETIVDRLERGSAPMRITQLRALGGAMAPVPNEATAFAHRHRRFLLSVVAVYGKPYEAATYEAWAGSLAAELQRGDPGAYVGFLGDEGEARVREAYPGPTWHLLAEIKTRYDPDNVFRLNQNVPPKRAA